MDTDTRATLIRFLRAHGTLTIATVRADGWPQATAVSYASDELTLYFAAGSDAQKIENIRRDARVSVTIQRDYDDWREVKGVSMAATAELLADAHDARHARQLLERKFARFAELGAADDFAGWTFVRLTPKVISLIDYSAGYGHKLQFNV